MNKIVPQVTIYKETNVHVASLTKIFVQEQNKNAGVGYTCGVAQKNKSKAKTQKKAKMQYRKKAEWSKYAG